MAISTTNVRVETAAMGLGAESLDGHCLVKKWERPGEARDQFQVLAGVR